MCFIIPCVFSPICILFFPVKWPLRCLSASCTPSPRTQVSHALSWLSRVIYYLQISYLFIAGRSWPQPRWTLPGAYHPHGGSGPGHRRVFISSSASHSLSTSSYHVDDRASLLLDMDSLVGFYQGWLTSRSTDGNRTGSRFKENLGERYICEAEAFAFHLETLTGIHKMSIFGSGDCDESTENTRKKGHAGFLTPWILWIANPLALVWMSAVNGAIVVQLCEYSKNHWTVHVSG